MEGFADNNLLLDPLARELSDPLSQLNNAGGLGAIAGVSPGGIGEQMLPGANENSPIAGGNRENLPVLETDTTITTGSQELAPNQDPLTGIFMGEQSDEAVATESLSSASQTLERSRQIAQDMLTSFAVKPEFTTQMNVAFGDNWDVGAGNSLATAWTSGDFSSIPDIEIRSGAEINGAASVFAGATNTIYISREYLSYNADNIEATAGVLLEEIGHAVDALVNDADSPGDEGAIFSALVRGQTLEPQQLEQMKAENDTASITLDGQVIQIEQSVNTPYSDAGGPEGDTAQIDLGTNKGTITLSYNTLTVPDRLQLQYEGKLIFDSGFVGTNGLRTVKVPFSGNSKEVTSVLTANLDDPSTVWQYTVDADPCAEPTPWNIEVVGGKFEDTDGDGDCDAQGTILIGRTDGILQMLRVEGATAEYDDNSLRVTDGTVFSEIGNVNEPLFKGSFTIDLKNATTSELTDVRGSLPNEFRLGGLLDIDFNGLTLNKNNIALKGGFTLPVDLGGFDLSLDGVVNSLFIDQNGPRFGVGGKINLPSGRFLLFQKLGLESTDWAIEFTPADNNALKIQGKATLKPFFKTIPALRGAEIVANLSDDNFIEIKNGDLDIKGAILLKNNFKLPGGWGLSEIGLTYQKARNEFGLQAKGTFPFAPRSPIPPAFGGQQQVGPGFGLEGSLVFPIPPGGLNSIGGELNNLNVAIGTSGFFWQKIAGKINNLQQDVVDPNPVEFSGGLGFTLGPKVQIPVPDAFLRGIGFPAEIEGAIGELDGTLTVSSEQAKGSAKLTFINDLVANIQGNLEYNWKKDTAKIGGSFGLLGNIGSGQGQITADTNTGSANGTANVSLKFPDSRLLGFLRNIELASGQAQIQYRNDSSTSNDFINVWGKINIPFANIGLIDAGKRYYYLEGRTENLGKELPETNSFAIEPDTDWVLLSANWDNPNPNSASVRVKDPSGNLIEESDFAANNIAIVSDLTSPQTKTVVVANPTPGIWDIEVVNSAGLGEVQYTAFRDSADPTIQVTAPATDVSGENVTINYNAFDADSEAEIALFYDTDNEGFDGIQITDGLQETDGAGNFVWNTEGVPTGDYYIYAMVMDENNPPAFSYSPGRVRITEEADLSVTKTASADPASIGNNLTYTIAVTNNGAVESKGVTLTDILPEGATLVSSSIPPATQLDNTLTFDLGNLASGQNATINITVTPTATGFITNTASVTSRTFDPDSTNDVDILTTIVDAIPVEPTELSISRTNSPDPVNLGEDFTYTLTVANNGITPATDVTLAESLPSGVNLVSATASRGTTSNVAGGLSANLGTLGSGEIATVDITVNPIAAGNLVSTTSVVSNEADANTTNNFLIQSQTANPAEIAPADLELIKTLDNPSPSTGDLVNLTLTLTNKGPGIASGIQVTDLLPSQLTFVSASSNQGSYDPSTGVWNVGNIRDGLSTPLIITATVNSGGSITSTAEITATGQADPDSTPNNNNPDEDDRASVSLNGSGGSSEFKNIFGIGDPPIVI